MALGSKPTCAWNPAIYYMPRPQAHGPSSTPRNMLLGTALVVVVLLVIKERRVRKEIKVNKDNKVRVTQDMQHTVFLEI